MHAELERLFSSLLYEGYALYPYTPGATKNSTPTPFGIAYPASYARVHASTFDHTQAECVLEAPADAQLEATVGFLQAGGLRHQAIERRLTVPAIGLDELGRVGAQVSARFTPADASGPELEVSLRLLAAPIGEGLWRMTLRAENRSTLDTQDARTIERAQALRHALLSTHLMAQVNGGRFISPLETSGELGRRVSECRSANTWPVLADPSDDSVLAAAIMLPDHPQLAPESRGNLFDNTEIEEALLLHVHALSDSERAQISEQDPAVRAMIERAAAATPAEMLALHGRMTMHEPGEGVLAGTAAVLNSGSAPAPSRPPQDATPPRPRDQLEPPRPPQDLELPGERDEFDPPRPHERFEPPRPREQPASPRPREQLEPPSPPALEHAIPGQEQVTLGEVTFRRGDRVWLRLGDRNDPYDRMLDGRQATIRRIVYDVDERLYFAVSVDDDPVHRLLGDSGRYLFFFEGEVEAVKP